MKTIILSLLVFVSIQSHSQENIVYITPAQLAENIKNSSNATLVKFWVPNCEAAPEIVKEFKELEDTYPGTIDFYFLGLTNKKELVEHLVNTIGYSHTIYIIDPSVHTNLVTRKETFAEQLCALLGIRQKDFIMLSLDKKDKMMYCGDAIETKKAKLQKLI